MIDFSEIKDGETWELFARDFLTELGFFIETSPDRGADAGKDMLASEELGGKLGRYKFRWLVSCKNNATSGKSVNEIDEQNILERIESFEADGFIGIYSTIPSSGLNTRLASLRQNLKIKDFRIFDHKLIENYLIRIGYSTLLIRYFPQSYINVKPLNLIVDEYLPLNCKVCNKDLLKSLFEEEYSGVIVNVENIQDYENDAVRKPTEITEIYFACKGEHDRQLESYFFKKNKLTTWTDLSDLVIPLNFIRFIMSHLNQIRTNETVYSEQAFQQLKDLIIAVAQKVLRETTGKEIDRVNRLISIEPF